MVLVLRVTVADNGGGWRIAVWPAPLVQARLEIVVKEGIGSVRTGRVAELLELQVFGTMRVRLDCCAAAGEERFPDCRGESTAATAFST